MHEFTQHVIATLSDPVVKGLSAATLVICLIRLTRDRLAAREDAAKKVEEPTNGR
jgi:hypothetical protein